MTTATFQEQLRRYAELLVVHGVNIQKGQVLQISAESCHRDLAFEVANAAYDRGAKFVMVDLSEVRLARKRLEVSSDEDLAFVPKFIPTKYEELLSEVGANIRITGSEEPDILSDLDPKKINMMQLAQRKALRTFYEEGIGKSRVHWTVAAAATPKWGQKVFPEVPAEEACQKLWEAIFRACRVDRPDFLEEWKAHNQRLQGRARMLTGKKIEELHFRGPGTDLKVRLSAKAIFKGGSDKSPRGVEFEPNIPTEEVFTTPDYRSTEGFVQTTRPFFINGKLVKGLRLRFEKGEIVEYAAEQGEETFAAYISSDPGAKRLGEVALVGVDSPIFQMGHVFQEILFDENAACHIAIGFAYRFCIEGGESMSPEELDAVGCNDSNVHTDMMISGYGVDVLAKLSSGEEFLIITNGGWVV